MGGVFRGRGVGIVPGITLLAERAVDGAPVLSAGAFPAGCANAYAIFKSESNKQAEVIDASYN
jgi:hypothetical protein